MIDYALLTLKCWSCEEDFQHFTDLSNHHLDAHERPLERYAVSDLMARSTPAVRREDCHICHHDRLMTLVCSRCGPECAACLEVECALEAERGPCSCGCAYGAHAAITAEMPLQRCGACPCLHFVLALKQETPPLASPLRWMWQTGGTTGYHDSAHTETPGCINAGCVPTGRTVCDEP